MDQIQNDEKLPLDDLYDEIADHFKSFYFNNELMYIKKCLDVAYYMYKQFRNKFYNLEVKTIFSYDERKTKYIRTVYGPYDKIDPNMSNKIINGLDGYEKMCPTTQSKYIEDFRVNLREYLKFYIELCVVFKNDLFNTDVLVLKPFLKNNSIYTCLVKKGFSTIGQIICLTKEEFKSNWDSKTKTGDVVIAAIEQLGLKFADDKEKNDSSDNFDKKDPQELSGHQNHK